MIETRIAQECPDQPDVIRLLVASDDYHAALYPQASNHLVDVSGLLGKDVRFLVARTPDGVAVGCGAILLDEEQGIPVAELKRMWVAPRIRGGGLGRCLLKALEAAAQREGAAVLRLETGIRQPEARALYSAAGYRECEPFGSYSADPLSVFMEKACGA